MQQRYGLSNRKILVTSRESTESTDGCHPSLSHYLPRPSRWSRTYACIAISKGNCTRATTRWLEIEQQFSPFLLKMAPSPRDGPAFEKRKIDPETFSKAGPAVRLSGSRGF